MLTLCRNCFCLFLILILAGCGTRQALAPVSELKWQPYSRYQKTHTVRRGETLFAIAFRYDTDYRSLARINHLRPPYSLRVGQVLSLQGIRHRTTIIRPGVARRYSQPTPRAPQRVIKMITKYLFIHNLLM